MADAIPAQGAQKPAQPKPQDPKQPQAVATAPVTGPYKWRSDGKGNLIKVPI